MHQLHPSKCYQGRILDFRNREGKTGSVIFINWWSFNKKIGSCMTVKRFIEDNITLLVMGPHGPLEYRDHLNQQGNGTT